MRRFGREGASTVGIWEGYFFNTSCDSEPIQFTGRVECVPRRGHPTNCPGVQPPNPQDSRLLPECVKVAVRRFRIHPLPGIPSDVWVDTGAPLLQSLYYSPLDLFV